MTEYTPGAYGSHATLLTSVDVAAATTEIEMLEMHGGYTHHFLGVQALDSSGDVIESGVTGTATIQIKTVNTMVYEDPPTNTIDLSSPVTIDWAGITESVKVTHAGLSGGGVTEWRVVITGVRS